MRKPDWKTPAEIRALQQAAMRGARAFLRRQNTATERKTNDDNREFVERGREIARIASPDRQTPDGAILSRANKNMDAVRGDVFGGAKKVPKSQNNS